MILHGNISAEGGWRVDSQFMGGRVFLFAVSQFLFRNSAVTQLMSARARGAIAFASPVTLCPVPVRPFQVGRWELCIFTCGFALLWSASFTCCQISLCGSV